MIDGKSCPCESWKKSGKNEKKIIEVNILKNNWKIAFSQRWKRKFLLIRFDVKSLTNKNCNFNCFMDSLGVELQKKASKTFLREIRASEKFLNFYNVVLYQGHFFLQMQYFRQSFVDKYETEKTIECCTSIMCLE